MESVGTTMPEESIKSELSDGPLKKPKDYHRFMESVGTTMPEESIKSELSDDKDKVNIHTDTSTGLFKCHICPYRTPYKGSLKSHFAVHSNDRPYACDLCEYEAKRLYDLKKHKIFKHGKQNLVTRRMKKTAVSLKKARDKRKSTPYKSVTHLNVPNVSVEPPLTIPVPAGMGPVFPEPIAVSSISASPKKEEPETVVVKPEPNGEKYWQSESHVHEDEVLDMRVPSRNIPENGGCRAVGEVVLRSSQDYSYDGPPSQVEYMRNERYTDGQSSSYTEYLQQHYGMVSQSPDSLQVASSSHRERTTSSSSSAASMIVSLLQRNHSSLSQSQDSLENSDGMPPKMMAKSSPMCLVQYKPTMSLPHIPKTGSGKPNCSGGEESADESSGSSAHNIPSSTSTRESAMITKRAWHCYYCDIMFFDSAVYFIHMGLHNGLDPWQCNLCGDRCHDVYSFTSHFVNQHRCK